MQAVILAAGAARRLAPLTDRTNKCLLRIDGRSLLDRMLAHLAAARVDAVTVVVGHCAEQVRAEAGERRGAMPVRFVDNAEYLKGSILSLWAARACLTADDCLVMDADVLFPAVFLQRLIGAPAPSALLLDRSFTDTGEEVKLFAHGDRVIALGKKVVPERWDAVGEGVGFFKCGRTHAAEYLRRLAAVIEETGGRDEYEDALHELLARVPVGWVDVTGLPWTEVDFVEDLRRAESVVWPEIQRLTG